MSFITTISLKQEDHEFFKGFCKKNNLQFSWLIADAVKFYISQKFPEEVNQ